MGAGPQGLALRFLVHAERDDVGVAVTRIDPGRVSGRFLRTGEELEAEVAEPVELGHKFALRDLPEGADVVKDGVRIGRTTAAVKRGSHVHVHNLQSVLWRPPS